MKITCMKSDLVKSINIAMKAVSNKTTLPILECILIECDDKIKMTATDMELGIETYVEGTIITPGRVALDAKLLFDIVKKFNDSEVTLETDENYNTTISCEKSKLKIPGKSGEDFSVIPEVEKNKGIKLSQFKIKEIVRQTLFSTAENESTKLMSGELFQIQDKTLRVVSLDGHRISIRYVALEEDPGQIKVVVPGKTLNEISKILEGGMEDMVDIYFTDRHILFEINDTKVVSRLMEGEYYKIDHMLSNDFETKVVVNKRALLDCIDRSSPIMKESDKKPIILKIEDDLMFLQATSSLGSMNEDLDIHKEGKNLMLGFNPKFIMDALRVIDSDEISMYFMNSKAPCYIKDDEESYRYVILPVNIN